MGRLHLQDIIQDMEDNFNFKKYLAEGKLYEAINLDIEDDIAILSGDSGEYEGEIEDGKASFSVIYDDLDYRISDQYDENNIEDFLGKGHAFVELAKKYDHKWGIERDLVGITIKLKDLAEGKLYENTINQISSRIVKLGKEDGIASEDIEEYVDDLESSFEPDAYKNTTDAELLDDLKLYMDLAEGVIKENITKLDNYALEIYSDFRKDPSIHFPDVEFEVDEEGFALENDSNYSQLKKYKREIMGLHALFGEESGVKDKNGLQLSMDGVIDNI